MSATHPLVGPFQYHRKRFRRILPVSEHVWITNSRLLSDRILPDEQNFQVQATNIIVRLTHLVETDVFNLSGRKGSVGSRIVARVYAIVCCMT